PGLAQSVQPQGGPSSAGRPTARERKDSMTRLRLASAIPVLGAILLAATPALPQAQPGGAPPPAATPPAATPPAAAATSPVTVGPEDAPFTRYCLVCETMAVPEDRSWIIFNLRSDARFHDGSPITPDDVIWTFNTLREHGHPLWRSYWGQVDHAERTGERGV